MQNTARTALAIKIALSYFTVGALCQNVHAQSEVRFRQVHEIVIVVPAMIDNQGPFDFVLDTGADTTIVDSIFAGEMAFKPRGEVQQSTLAGVQKSLSSVAPKLAIGAAQVENLPVLVQDLATLRKIDSRVHGIVGQDFLSRFNYLLDYERRSIRFELDCDISHDIDGDPVPIEKSARRMLVPSLAQSVGQANLRLLLDSGADAVVLFPGA
jgi:hypothetical protein